jgi:hypothetical protein
MAQESELILSYILQHNSSLEGITAVRLISFTTTVLPGMLAITCTAIVVGIGLWWHVLRRQAELRERKRQEEQQRQQQELHRRQRQELLSQRFNSIKSFCSSATALAGGLCIGLACLAVTASQIADSPDHGTHLGKAASASSTSSYTDAQRLIDRVPGLADSMELALKRYCKHSNIWESLSKSPEGRPTRTCQSWKRVSDIIS